MGIPCENIEKIFLPYYQITHNKSNLQGLGMGLYIVKNIVEQSGGIINVKSEIGKGSVFEILLPACEYGEFMPEAINYPGKKRFPAPELFIKIENEKYDPSKKTILVVEDNNNLLASLVNSLKNDYNILFAANAFEAFNVIPQSQKIDLIISDIMMDKMDGYEFFERYKKKYINNDTPFIFLTAKTSSDDRKKGLSLGAIDFICKPFAADELKLKIKSIMDNIDRIQKQSVMTLRERVINVFENGGNVFIQQENNPFNIDEFAGKYNFTGRENQVFKFIIEGKMNKEMADELNISISSVKKYVFNIYRKLGVNTRLELNNMLYKKNDRNI
jgi:DNA-binding NarL/FixJ family response regulator